MSWEDYVVKVKKFGEPFYGNATFVTENGRRYIQKPSKEHVKDNLTWAYNEFVSYRIAEELKLPHVPFGIMGEGEHHYFCCEVLPGAKAIGDDSTSLLSAGQAGDILVFDLFVMNSDRALYNLLVHGDSVLVIDLDKSLLGNGKGDLHRIEGCPHEKIPSDFINYDELVVLIERWSNLLGMIERVMQLPDEKLDSILRDVPNDWIDKVSETVINRLANFMIGWKYELPGMLYRNRYNLFPNFRG